MGKATAGTHVFGCQADKNGVVMVSLNEIKNTMRTELTMSVRDLDYVS